MSYNGFPIGIGRNPLVNSVFVQSFQEHGDFPPPPASEFRITDGSEQRVTDIGDKRITD